MAVGIASGIAQIGVTGLAVMSSNIAKLRPALQLP